MPLAENKIIFDTVRPWLEAPGFAAPGRIESLNQACASFAAALRALPAGAELQAISPAYSWQDLLAKLTNRNAPALTEADFAAAADMLGHGVTPKHMKASKKVEAPKGAFDDQGRPTILYERHVFARNTTPKGRFNATNPELSGGPYGPGGYGAFSAQYGKLERAFALDPIAAFEACSWGAFQVLGENAVELGYENAIDMALTLATSEAAHLDLYVRYVRFHGLADELGACRPGAPNSCIPFVERYNGPAYARFNYHKNFAAALM